MSMSRLSSPPRTKSASAPYEAALRAESTSSMFATYEMPSPSAIAWLKLRCAFTSGDSRNSLPHRVPHRLQLEEGGDLPRALSVGAPADDALDVLCCEALELRPVTVGAAEVDRVDVHVGREHRAELRVVAREEVDDAAG